MVKSISKASKDAAQSAKALENTMFHTMRRFSKALEDTA